MRERERERERARERARARESNVYPSYTYIHLILTFLVTPSGQLWVQAVSTTPATSVDVQQLQEELDLRLQEQSAFETGICPVRRELYTQCFGECSLSLSLSVISLVAHFLLSFFHPSFISSKYHYVLRVYKPHIQTHLP